MSNIVKFLTPSRLIKISPKVAKVFTLTSVAMSGGLVGYTVYNCYKIYVSYKEEEYKYKDVMLLMGQINSIPPLKAELEEKEVYKNVCKHMEDKTMCDELGDWSNYYASLRDEIAKIGNK